jgi:probable HAF family extracellular repeat protein
MDKEGQALMTMTFSRIGRFSGGFLRSTRRGGVGKRRSTRQPRLESLEGRVVPSTAYQVINLGTLGGRNAEATAINNQGQVVGYSDTSQFTTRAFRDIHRNMISLGSLLGGTSIATSINNRGQIVGSSINKDGSASQAFIYSNGRMRPIIGKLPGTLPNHQTRPLVINDRDQIIGFATKSGNALVHSGGRFVDIGSLNGLGSVAEGLNDHGAIVGYSNLTPFHDVFNQGIQHAFVYQHGQMTDLGTLGGTYSTATAINNHGDVVGFSSTTGDLAQDVFLYHNGAMTDLGRLSGGSAAFPTAINDKGQVIGWSYVAGIGVDQFLYSDGEMIDLSTLIPASAGLKLGSVVGINNRGQIAAVGIMPNRHEVALLLNPVTRG